MSDNSRTGRYSSTSNNDSTLRPRTTRLISYLGENDEERQLARDGRAVSTSSLSQRQSSPSSSLYGGTTSRRSGKFSSQADVSTERADGKRQTATNGLWDPWGQIQGIASTFLGSDTSNATTNSNTRTTSPFKTPLWMKQDRSHRSSKQTQKWGPRAPDKIGIGPGSIEERQAMLQAKRRETLLLASTDDGKDASGRFKRKGSNASLTIHSPLKSDDVLVYRHRVSPEDTMAGVTIKYSCQQDVFRKVNRLWPNDKIQIREHVFLPVDACAIRGRKVDQPDDVELLDEEQSKSKSLEESHAGSVNGIKKSSPITMGSTMSSITGDDDEGYKHDSWVLLTNFPRAVQILRISRTALGYFPPARRKSNHHLLPPDVGTRASSPRSSFDNLRHPPTHAAQQAQLQHQSLRISSAESPSRQVPKVSSRHRSYSTATTSSHQANKTQNTFFSALQGPGGVGSLRGLRTESSRPGPANDSLNQNFAKYLPSLALTTAPSENHSVDEEETPHARVFNSQVLRLPRASMDSLRSSRSGRSNSSASAFGGVENWVKKIASAAGTTRPNASRTNSDRTIGPGKSGMGVGIAIGGETGLGDLIELETNSDVRLPHPDEFDHDDNENTPKIGSSQDTSISEQDLLNERFPIRGRVTKAYGAKN